jgi:cell division protein ZapA
MATVTVTIAGKSYRMACGDGEEEHLTGLAAMFDDKITDMRGSFGEIGDMRLHVMAALAIADELSEIRIKIGELQKNYDTLSRERDEGLDRLEHVQTLSAGAIAHASDRIEKLAKSLARSAGTQAE